MANGKKIENMDRRWISGYTHPLVISSYSYKRCIAESRRRFSKLEIFKVENVT